MKKIELTPRYWAIAWLALCWLSTNALGVGISVLTSTNFLYDSGGVVACNYVQCAITNDTSQNLDNLWVKLDTLSGPNITFGYGGSGLHNLGKLNAHTMSSEAIFYLRTTNMTKSLKSTESYVIRVYQGYPGAGGTELLSKTNTMTFADITVNQSYKVASVSYSPMQPMLGAVFTVNMAGVLTGGLKQGDAVAFLPASSTNWNVGAFDFIGAVVYLTNNNVQVGTTNILSFNMPVAADSYRAEYSFRAASITSNSTPVSPDFAVRPNTSWVHSDVSSVSIPAILPPTNAVVITNFASVTQLYTNETLSYTVRFINSGSSAVTIDQVIDTLPADFTYVAGSTLFNGTSVPDPLINGTTNSWSEPLVVAGGASRDLVFRVAVKGANTTVTNSVIAYIAQTLIDTTLDTANTSPAKSNVRVLWEPTAVSDTGTVLEDGSLSVSASGVLANDVEPNGFSLTVATYTQPSHGTVTANANGAYTYTPVAQYYGADSFTYTLTNTNGRSVTSDVRLTVTSVNDAPSFVKGANQTVRENAGAQTAADWATAISVGPANESSQTPTFHLSADNAALFAVQPAVAADGTLTYTPAVNASGSATVSIWLSDSGGTANSGVDTSATQSFTISVVVAPDLGVGGSFNWTINSADGTAGGNPGWQLLGVTGKFTITTTGDTRSALNLRTLTPPGNSSGAMSNFDAAKPFYWTILTASDGIVGFSPERFSLNTNDFYSSLDGGSFAVTQVGNTLQLVFNPAGNHPPTAASAVAGTMRGEAETILAAKLLAKCFDLDGDTLTLTGVSPSTRGGSATLEAGIITYTPPSGFAGTDTFTYSISDERGGVATGTVTVRVASSLSANLMGSEYISSPSRICKVKFAGLPGATFQIQVSDDMVTWVTLPGSATVVPSNGPNKGVGIYIDSDPPLAGRYYRTIHSNGP